MVGPKGAGKSTAAKILRDVWQYKVLSFATPLKLELYRLLWDIREGYPFSGEESFRILHAAGLVLKDLPMPPSVMFEDDAEKIEWVNANKQWLRTALQNLGTEYYRNQVDINYWVKELLNEIDSKMIVVDDCRFENEAEALREEGFVFAVITGRGERDDHSSETDSEKWIPMFAEYFIPNQGTYKDLVRNIDGLYKDVNMRTHYVKHS